MDEALFRAINNGLAGPKMDWLMVTATSPESWLIPGLIFMAALIFKYRKQGAVAIVTALCAVGFGDALAHQVIKPTVGRQRPCAALTEVRQPGGVGCTESFSFPSNHAVNSASIAAAVGTFYPKTLIILAPMAALVGLSRVAVGVHYPLDVAAGELLGIIIGVSMALLARRLSGKGAVEEKTEAD